MNGTYTVSNPCSVLLCTEELPCDELVANNPRKETMPAARFSQPQTRRSTAKPPINPSAFDGGVARIFGAFVGVDSRID